MDGKGNWLVFKRRVRSLFACQVLPTKANRVWNLQNWFASPLILFLMGKWSWWVIETCRNLATCCCCAWTNRMLLHVFFSRPSNLFILAFSNFPWPYIFFLKSFQLMASLLVEVGGLDWFGSPYERECYVGHPGNPKPPGPKPTISHYLNLVDLNRLKDGIQRIHQFRSTAALGLDTDIAFGNSAGFCHVLVLEDCRFKACTFMGVLEVFCMSGISMLHDVALFTINYMVSHYIA